jgi:hypothetical protein
MRTDTILNGILAVLVAERDGLGGRPTERILSEAGLSDQHIATLTGQDPARLDQPPVTAFGHAAASTPAGTRSATADHQRR